MGYDLSGIPDSAQPQKGGRKKRKLKLFCFTKSGESAWEHLGKFPWEGSVIVAAYNEKEARRLLPPRALFTDPNDSSVREHPVTQAEIKRGLIAFQ